MNLLNYYSNELYNASLRIISFTDIKTSEFKKASERLVGLTRAWARHERLVKEVGDTKLFLAIDTWTHPKASKLYAEALIDAYSYSDTSMCDLFDEDLTDAAQLAELMDQLEAADRAEVSVVFKTDPSDFKVVVFNGNTVKGFGGY